MKKIKGFVLPFALVLGLLSVLFLSAFTTQTKKTNETDYYWFDDLGYTQHYTDKGSEMFTTQCPDSGENICENGYSAEDFNTYDDPDSGLNEEAVPEAVILKE